MQAIFTVFSTTNNFSLDLSGETAWQTRQTLTGLHQGSFDHVKVGPTPVLALHNL